MSPTVDKATSVTTSVADRIEVLRTQGWEVTDTLRSIRLETPGGITGQDLVETFDQLAPLAIDVSLTTQTGFRLGKSDSRLVVLSVPDHLTDHYVDADLATAQRFSEGEIQAVMDLPDLWTGTITLDLATHLSRAMPEITWRAVRSLDIAVAALTEIGWAGMGDLVGSSQPIVCVILSGDPVRWVAPAIALVTPEFVPVEPPEVPADKADAVRSASGTRPPTSVLLPEELLASSEMAAPDSLRDLLSGFASASAWAWLADGVEIEASGEATLEFFGWRQITARIPKRGLEGQSAQRAALELYRWATAEESPDRFLAIKQVLSVYSDDRFLTTGDAVRRGAEPVYRSLRSSIVAEVVASQRDARRMAREAAREAADAVLSAAKSVSERTIAALVALGGLSIASATSTAIPDTLVDKLAFGVGVFMITLALWSVIVEAPTIGLPLSALESDLGEVDDLIGPEAREQILGLKAVLLAKRRALIVRIASPLAYLVVAALAMALARPFPTWLWSLLGLA